MHALAHGCHIAVTQVPRQTSQGLPVVGQHDDVGERRWRIEGWLEVAGKGDSALRGKGQRDKAHREKRLRFGVFSGPWLWRLPW